MAEAKICISTEDEIKLLEERVAELKKEVDSMEKYKTYKKGSDEMTILFKAFEDSGFSRKETMELVRLGMMQNMKLF